VGLLRSRAVAVEKAKGAGPPPPLRKGEDAVPSTAADKRPVEAAARLSGR